MENWDKGIILWLINFVKTKKYFDKKILAVRGSTKRILEQICNEQEQHKF